MTPPKEKSKLSRVEVVDSMLRLVREARDAGDLTFDSREAELAFAARTRRVRMLADRADNMDAFFDA